MPLHLIVLHLLIKLIVSDEVILRFTSMMLSLVIVIIATKS